MTSLRIDSAAGGAARPSRTVITTRGTTYMTARLLQSGTRARTARRRSVRAVGASALAVVLFAFGASSAFAVVGHSNTSSFGSSGVGESQFGPGSPRGVAVDQGTGDVYVADPGNARVERFTADGTFVSAWGWGVSDGSAAAQVCTSGCQGGVPGSGAGQFTSPAFVAVDNSGGLSDGSVYVADTATNLVQKFDAAGNLVFTWGSGGQLDGSSAPNGPFGPIAGIAVDSAGVLNVFDTNTQMFEFTESGAFITSFATVRGTAPNGLAVDGAGNFFKVNGTPSVEKFDSAGNDLGQVTASTSATDIAVDPATGDLYVATTQVVDAQGVGIVERYAFNGSGEVVQADSSTCAPGDFVGCPATETFSSDKPLGIAVRASDGRVYVSDQAASEVDIMDIAVFPDVATGAASAVTPTTAALNGTVDPDGVEVTDCHFEYVTEAGFQADGFADADDVACDPDPGSGSGDVAVSADVIGLSPGESYRFRLVAANALAISRGDSQEFGTPGPSVGGPLATQVTTSAAKLTARVNPNGKSTTYHFEYGTTASYGQTTPESASVGSDDTDHQVGQTITGLTPGTTYHFRVVATNPDATTNGADATFTTYSQPPTFDACPNDAQRTAAAGRLPDCRAYEQVSPADKGGSAIARAYGFTRATASGDAFNFASAAGLRGIGGFVGQDAGYVSRRDGSGWSTGNQLSDVSQLWDVAPTAGWSDDLGQTFAFPTIDGEKQVVLIDLASDTYQVVGHLPNQHFSSLADFSADGSKMIFESDAQLLPEAAAGVNNLYAWDSDTQSLTLAGVLPDGSTPPDGSAAGPGSSQPLLYKQNTLSDDGDQAVFTAGGQLYVRKNLTSGAASTDQVSASQKTNGSGPGGTDPLGPQPATFMAATPSGSKVLFISAEELTDDANTGTSDEGNDLYSYDVASGELTDLTVDDDPNGADVFGVLGASDDGATVYFVANGALAAGATPGDCTRYAGFSGHCSLYVRRNDVTRFVATLGALNGDSSDEQNWLQGALSNERSSRVTPDGGALLFRSVNQITAYDSGGRREVYRYDAVDQQLLCVSCDPTGSAPSGPSGLHDLFISDFGTGGWYASNPARNLSSSGDRVFFESPDPLVVSDTNSIQDVYEWEAEGSGSCRSASENGGCLYLLSSGRGAAASYFGDASASGDDAFILTDDQLVGQDRDGAMDAYDVRVGGGIAAQNPPAPAPPCSGDGCRDSATAPPSAVVAGSVTFDGAGNAPGRRAPLVARVSVPTKAVKGPSFLLRTRLPAAGVVRASGGSIKSVRRSVGKAGSLRLRITLTAKAKSKLKQRKRLALKFKVAFKPRSGPKSTVSVSLTVKA